MLLLQFFTATMNEMEILNILGTFGHFEAGFSEIKPKG
jgi:hypothetical protein